jgi:hypothetical protein
MFIHTVLLYYLYYLYHLYSVPYIYIDAKCVL